MTTLNLIAIRDGENNGGFYSPAKEKAAIRGPYQHRFHFFRRLRHNAKLKFLLLLFCALCGVVFFPPEFPLPLAGIFTPLLLPFPLLGVEKFALCLRVFTLVHVRVCTYIRLETVFECLGSLVEHSYGIFLGCGGHCWQEIEGTGGELFSTDLFPFPFFLLRRGGYTVLMNTWKRNSLLKQSVAHYASCHGTDAIHVVWSESDRPSDSLKQYLKNIVMAKSYTARKPNFKFDVNEEDNLNNRFKPIKDLRTDAIFSVDDDVIVPCDVLDFAFTMWQTAPSSMVGFVPRMHWLGEKKDSHASYQYGGWWSVWWTGSYSMVLSKAAFFHRKYLDMYTIQMPASIRDYVTRERNCEDIAMSLLVANATAAPPIWVKGKIHEIGSYGISSLQDHSSKRHKCLNDFVSLYGAIPLVSTNVKAVDARKEWFW